MAVLAGKRSPPAAAQAAVLGLVRPQPFPQPSLLAARAGLTGAVEPRQADFCRAVFVAEFAEGLSIGEPATLVNVAVGLDLDADRMLEQAASPAVKDRLKAETAEAQSLGLFGAPSFVAPDGELFWGNDRLEQALAWAAGG